MPFNFFHGIIGHAAAQEVLSRMIATDRLPHAFLFVGPHHVGKSTVAKQLVEHLNHGASNSIDTIEIGRLTDEKTGKKKSAISVEQIREACTRMSLSSFGGGYKIALITEANFLSPGAGNALLKTLEEPKGKTLFILRSPSIESVLGTLTSRCQIMRFHPVDRASLRETFVKKGFAADDAQKAAAISLGRPGLAIRYLTKSDDRAHMDIGVSQTLEIFASPCAKQLRLIGSLLPKEDVNKHHAAKEIVVCWQQVLRDLLLRKIGCDEWMVHMNLPASLSEISLQDLVTRLHRSEESRDALRHNTNPLLSLEHVLL